MGKEGNSPSAVAYSVVFGALTLAFTSSIPGGMDGGTGFVVGIGISYFLILLLVALSHMRIGLSTDEENLAPKERNETQEIDETFTTKSTANEGNKPALVQSATPPEIETADWPTDGEQRIRARLNIFANQLLQRVENNPELHSLMQKSNREMRQFLDDMPPTYLEVLSRYSDEKLRNFAQEFYPKDVLERLKPQAKQTTKSLELDRGIGESA